MQTMRGRACTISCLLSLALAACVPGVAEYTKTEAPTALRVDGSHSTVTLIFARGSDRLGRSQTERLAGLVKDGDIGPADRVEIAVAGGANLARNRFAAISRELLRYGIVANPRPQAGVPPDRAIIMVGQYAVTLPPCPNWSKSPATDFSNEPTSNFGCANAVNLGLMVASPADLVAGRPLGPAAGKPAASAVDRYLDDKVTPLMSTEVGPIAAPSGGGSPPPAGP
jgi:pilus assembly protein CpaD